LSLLKLSSASIDESGTAGSSMKVGVNPKVERCEYED